MRHVVRLLSYASHSTEGKHGQSGFVIGSVEKVRLRRSEKVCKEHACHNSNATKQKDGDPQHEIQSRASVTPVHLLFLVAGGVFDHM